VVDETRAASVHRPGAMFCSAAAVAAAEYSSCGDSSSSSSSSAAKRRRSSSSIPSVDAAAAIAAATATVDTAVELKVADDSTTASQSTASSSHNSGQQQQQQQQEDLTEVTAAVSSSSTITRALCGKAQDVHILYGCDGARQCWRGLNVAAILSGNSSAIAACRKAAAVSCPPSQLALLALHASLTSTTAGTHTAAAAAVDKSALREKYLAVAQCLESCGLLYIQVQLYTVVTLY
jgi:hypothetical protein